MHACGLLSEHMLPEVVDILLTAQLPFEVTTATTQGTRVREWLVPCIPP